MSTLTAPTTTDHGSGTILRRTGAGALLAGPLCMLAGMMTCPPQESDSAADYITSLARTGWLTEVSALFLHYGLILSALGAFAVPGLIRGAKGRLITVLGTILAAIGLLNVSGAVKDDWWRMVIGQQLPLDVAVRISDTVDASPFLVLWKGTELFAFLGLLFICVGLARAGVVGWWLTGAFLATFASMMFIPVGLTYVAGFAFTMLYLPLFVAGLRVLRRERLAA